MQRDARGAQELGEPADVAAVVGVASVGGALPGGDETTDAQLAQVIRHETLGFGDQVAQLTDTSIAPAQLVQELPAERVGDELQELERRDFVGGNGHVPMINQSGLMYQVGLIQSSRDAQSDAATSTSFGFRIAASSFPG